MSDLKVLMTKLEAAKTKAAQAQGAYHTYLAQLQALGYDSVEDADLALDALQKKLTQTRETLDAELAKFRAQWGHLVQV